MARLCSLAGLCLSVLVLAGVALQAVLVWALVPDRPRDPNAGGLPTCSTVACIDEARTAYVALAVMLVAVSVAVVTIRRPSWAGVAGCLLAALALIVIQVDPDLEPLLRWAAVGMAILSVGVWLRLADPLPPAARERLGPRLRHLRDVAAREALEAWRDAGLPVPRSHRPGPGATPGAAGAETTDPASADRT